MVVQVAVRAVVPAGGAAPVAVLQEVVRRPVAVPQLVAVRQLVVVRQPAVVRRPVVRRQERVLRPDRSASRSWRQPPRSRRAST